jgi:hypothetical protein
VSRVAGYRIVAFGSTTSVVSGVPSSKQKFRDVSAYVRLQVGQRFICCESHLSLTWTESVPPAVAGGCVAMRRLA